MKIKEIVQTLAIYLIILVISGCATTAVMAPKASSYIGLAQTLLHQLDAYYGKLVDLKAVPDHRTEATKALAVADVTAEMLRQVLSGKEITDAQANVLAGQVDGVRALAEQIKK